MKRKGILVSAGIGLRVPAPWQPRYHTPWPREPRPPACTWELSGHLKATSSSTGTSTTCCVSCSPESISEQGLGPCLEAQGLAIIPRRKDRNDTAAKGGPARQDPETPWEGSHQSGGGGIHRPGFRTVSYERGSEGCLFTKAKCGKRRVRGTYPVHGGAGRGSRARLATLQDGRRVKSEEAS